MTIVAAGAIGASAMLLVGRDKTPPKLTISDDADYTYSPGQSREDMLQGVSATDDRDGDVLDRVIVEKVAVNEAGTEAEITYVVTDKSNNVTKKIRKVSCDGTGNSTSDSASAQTQETSGETDTQTDTAAGSDSGDATAASENGTTTGTDGENGDQEESEEAVNPEAPVIQLTDSQVKIKRGEKFSVLNYVKEITDDKDERSRLYNNIEVKGSVDTNRSGTYELQYFVTDSDGNKSAEADLTVTVE